MTYNPNGEDTHEYDPYEDAMTDRPSYFFGMVQNRAWPVVGSRPPGMPWKGNTTFEDYIEELHGPMAEVNRDPDKFISTNIEFSLTPTDPTRPYKTRKMSTGMKEFKQVVRPSIIALGEQVAAVKGLTPGQFNLLAEFADVWVKGEYVLNPDNKSGETWRTWKFLHVYANQQECTEAANDQFGNGDEATEVPDEQSAEDATKANLVAFLEAFWEQVGHDPDKLAEMLPTNDLLKDHFTMDSPEVKALISPENTQEV